MFIELVNNNGDIEKINIRFACISVKDNTITYADATEPTVNGFITVPSEHTVSLDNVKFINIEP